MDFTFVRLVQHAKISLLLQILSRTRLPQPLPFNISSINISPPVHTQSMCFGHVQLTGICEHSRTRIRKGSCEIVIGQLHIF
jgi:hypothetical protein